MPQRWFTFRGICENLLPMLLGAAALLPLESTGSFACQLEVALPWLQLPWYTDPAVAEA